MCFLEELGKRKRDFQGEGEGEDEAGDCMGGIIESRIQFVGSVRGQGRGEEAEKNKKYCRLANEFEGEWARSLARERIWCGYYVRRQSPGYARPRNRASADDGGDSGHPRPAIHHLDTGHSSTRSSSSSTFYESGDV